MSEQVDAEDPIERAAYYAPVCGEVKMIGSGINTTRRLALVEGGEGYFKSFEGLDHGAAEERGDRNRQQPIHEAAAWQLARNLGPEYAAIVAPCGIRSFQGQWGSFSMAAPGVIPPQVRDPRRMLGEAGTEQIDTAAFFDAVSGNMDRHPGNMLISHGRLALIDHGFAFHQGPAAVSVPLEDRLARDKASLTETEKFQLDRLLASKDALGMAGILEGPRVAALLGRARMIRSQGSLAGASIFAHL